MLGMRQNVKRQEFTYTITLNTVAVITLISIFFKEKYSNMGNKLICAPLKQIQDIQKL